MGIDWNMVVLTALVVIAALVIIVLLVVGTVHEQNDWTDIPPEEYYALPGTASVLLRYKDETGGTCMHTCHKCNLRAVIMDLQARGCSDIHILKLGR